MSALIYVETSIPSFYHETRSELEHQARREWTRRWWELAMARDTLVTSATVPNCDWPTEAHRRNRIVGTIATACHAGGGR